MPQHKDFADKVKDRDNHTCIKCGHKPSNPPQLHAHHIQPKTEGGSNAIENGATLCNQCHDFAPDNETVIKSSAYKEAFEVYRTTFNPALIDILWFGMRIAEQSKLSAHTMRRTSLPKTLPHMQRSNWWVAFAMLADYKTARNWLEDVEPQEKHENIAELSERLHELEQQVDS